MYSIPFQNTPLTSLPAFFTRLLRYVKHSISSMWTSSMNSTPGTSSATPWSMYRFTTCTGMHHVRTGF